MKLFNIMSGILAAFSFLMGLVTLFSTVTNDRMFAGFFLLGCGFTIMFGYTSRLMQSK